MKRILGMSSIRSDYDLMSGVYRRLASDSSLKFKLLVSGAHLSMQHGRTVDLIRRDGIDFLAAVETLINGDSHASRLKTAVGLLNCSIDLIQNFNPDVLIYAGDREDVLVGGMIGAFLGIPTVHFFGGDHACDGHVDNPIRHATSKLSTAHFVSTNEHRQRLLHLGEEDERVFVIGSVALDKFISEKHLDQMETLEGIGAKPHAQHASSKAILIFHPLEQEKNLASQYITDVVDVLIAHGFHVFIGAPNTDPGNNALLCTIQILSGKPEVTFYKNTSRSFFVNLMRHANLMVGNSSAGIQEAASVGLPVINIGLRQKHRFCGPNVIFCNGDKVEFQQAISRINSQAFIEMLRTIKNPYGDGNSAGYAVRLLKEIDFRPLLQKTKDPLSVRT